MTQRLKILVCAYACSPGQGSEPGVGWGFVTALAERHDLWVIAEEEKFREPVESYLATHPQLRDRLRFTFVRKRRNRWLRKVWPPSYYWYYAEWHRRALESGRRLHAEVGFDLVHQLTMVGFREPGFLWKLGLPFVWGPIGGMGFFPWRFLGKVGLYGALFYSAYNVINWLQLNLASRPRAAARAAGRGLVAATEENQRGALRYWGCPSVILPEVGLSGLDPKQVTVREKGQPLALVWSGQHTPGKALNIGLEALAEVPKEVDWTLDVLGVGRETSRWMALAARLGILPRCRFHGWLARNDALAVASRAHAMLITSLRDLTSTVTLEGLSLGLPVVCPAHCGFVGAVDETCGVLVSVATPRSFRKDVVTAITRLAADEPWRQSLARGALARANEFIWSSKAAALERIYWATVQAHAQRGTHGGGSSA